MGKKRFIKFGLTAITALISGISIIISINSYLMNRMVENEIKELVAAAQKTESKIYSTNDIANLPDPVQRYFRYVLKNGQEYIRFAKVKAKGWFRTPGQKEWAEIDACQYFITNPPGLVFDAVMKQGVIWFDVRDKYWLAKGGMYVNLLSGINVVDEYDIKELNETTFLRWVGEAIMFPTALLPSQYIKWKPIDSNSAELTVTDGHNTGTYKFYFNATGEIIKYESDNRYDRINGKLLKVGSVAVRSDYQELNGVKIPTKFLLTRILPNSNCEEFWKGEITDISYNMPEIH